MVLLGSFVLILSLLGQTSSTPVYRNDIFNSEELLKLQKEDSIEKRIKVYQEASERVQKTLEQSVAKEEFDTVPDRLGTWTLLLAESLTDIETNLKAKKKPRDLIKYEIHVRKAIGDMEGYKLKAPVDQQEAFRSCIDQAERIHKKFVELLFRLNS